MIGEKGKLFRYNFRFSKEENDMLKTLSKKNKSSYSDVIRTALRIYFAMCMKNSWYFVHTNGCFVHTNDFLNCMHKLFLVILYIQNDSYFSVCTYKIDEKIWFVHTKCHFYAHFSILKSGQRKNICTYKTNSCPLFWAFAHF